MASVFQGAVAAKCRYLAKRNKTRPPPLGIGALAQEPERVATCSRRPKRPPRRISARARPVLRQQTLVDANAGNVTGIARCPSRRFDPVRAPAPSLRLLYEQPTISTDLEHTWMLLSRQVRLDPIEGALKRILASINIQQILSSTTSL